MVERPVFLHQDDNVFGIVECGAGIWGNVGRPQNGASYGVMEEGRRADRGRCLKEITSRSCHPAIVPGLC